MLHAQPLNFAKANWFLNVTFTYIYGNRQLAWKIIRTRCLSSLWCLCLQHTPIFAMWVYAQIIMLGMPQIHCLIIMFCSNLSWKVTPLIHQDDSHQNTAWTWERVSWSLKWVIRYIGPHFLELTSGCALHTGIDWLDGSNLDQTSSHWGHAGIPG